MNKQTKGMLIIMLGTILSFCVIGTGDFILDPTSPISRWGTELTRLLVYYIVLFGGIVSLVGGMNLLLNGED